jgi:hypothetical protein
MNTELDVNKIVVDFLRANVDSAFALGSARLKGAKDLIRSKFESTYRSYLLAFLGDTQEPSHSSFDQNPSRSTSSLSHSILRHSVECSNGLAQSILLRSPRL